MTIARLPAFSAVNSENSPAASPAANNNPRSRTKDARRSSNFESNFFDTLHAETSPKVAGDRESVGSETTDEEGEAMTATEKRVLDAVADDLARLGRVKRVSLGVEEKAKFVDAWAKGTRSRK